MNYKRNGWRHGECETCEEHTQVIKFDKKLTCSDCLTKYDDDLKVEDFVYNTSNCQVGCRGSVTYPGRSQANEY